MQNQHIPAGGLMAGPAALHGPRPYWAGLDHAPFHILKSPRSLSYDLIIVGAGLSGAMLAEAMSDGKRSILVIDRRMPLSCTATSAKASIQPELDLPLQKLAQQIGRERAERLWSRSGAAVEKTLALAERLGGDCGLSKRSLLRLASAVQEPEDIAAEADMRVEAGLGTRFITREKLIAEFGVDRPAALLSENCATVNPVQLNALLLRQATKQGAEVAAHQEIIDVRQTGSEIHLLTSDGDFLGARQVVFCTGHELPLISGIPSLPHASTWAIATRPGLALPQWLSDHVIEEAGSTGLHIRTTADQRLLIGMEDEAEAHLSLSPERHEIRSRMLADKASQLIGVELGEPDFAWSGVVGRPDSGRPLIGGIPGFPGVYAISGLSAGSMSLCQLATDMLKAEIDGDWDQDADLFAFPDDAREGRLHA